MKIYLIAKQTRHITGHGESETTWDLTDNPYPAFTSKAGAIQFFIDAQLKKQPQLAEYYNQYPPSVLELEVIDNWSDKP